VSNVYEVRHRVLRERLKQMVATAKQVPHDECVRLALLSWHCLTGTRWMARGGAGTAEHRVNGGGDDRAGARRSRW
jgi:hypothetical protein